MFCACGSDCGTLSHKHSFTLMQMVDMRFFRTVVGFIMADHKCKDIKEALAMQLINTVII